jgi:hypothetical protein
MGPDTRFLTGNSSIKNVDREVSSYTGKNYSLTGKRGQDEKVFSIPVPYGNPLNVYMTMFSCNI